MSEGKKKVFLVTNSMMVGGLNSVILDQVFAFSQAGCDVQVVLLNDKGALPEDIECNVHFLRLSDSHALFRYRILYSFFRPFLKGIGNYFSGKYNRRVFDGFLGESGANDDDLIILHGFKTVVSLRQVDHPGLIKVMHEMQSDHVGPGMWVLKGIRARIIRSCYRKGTRVAVSDAVRKDYRNEVRGEDCVEVISNGINTEKVKALSDQPLPLDLPRPYIVSVGRFVPVKGFDVLIRAYSASSIKGVYDLVIVGEGKERESLEGLVGELGLAGQVFFPGYVDPPFAIMRNAHLYVGASYHEGFGLALLEAIALGVPVLASRVSGFEEIIWNCGGGMFEAGDVDQLRGLLDDFESPKSRGDDICLGKYDFDAVVERYLKVTSEKP